MTSSSLGFSSSSASAGAPSSSIASAPAKELSPTARASALLRGHRHAVECGYTVRRDELFVYGKGEIVQRAFAEIRGHKIDSKNRGQFCSLFAQKQWEELRPTVYRSLDSSSESPLAKAQRIMGYFLELQFSLEESVDFWGQPCKDVHPAPFYTFLRTHPCFLMGPLDPARSDSRRGRRLPEGVSWLEELCQGARCTPLRPMLRPTPASSSAAPVPRALSPSPAGELPRLAKAMLMLYEIRQTSLFHVKIEKKATERLPFKVRVRGVPMAKEEGRLFSDQMVKEIDAARLKILGKKPLDFLPSQMEDFGSHFCEMQLSLVREGQPQRFLPLYSWLRMELYQLRLAYLTIERGIDSLREVLEAVGYPSPEIEDGLVEHSTLAPAPRYCLPPLLPIPTKDPDTLLWAFSLLYPIRRSSLLFDPEGRANPQSPPDNVLVLRGKEAIRKELGGWLFSEQEIAEIERMSKEIRDGKIPDGLSGALIRLADATSELQVTYFLSDAGGETSQWTPLSAFFGGKQIRLLIKPEQGAPGIFTLKRVSKWVFFVVRYVQYNEPSPKSVPRVGPAKSDVKKSVAPLAAASSSSSSSSSSSAPALPVPPSKKAAPGHVVSSSSSSSSSFVGRAAVSAVSVAAEPRVGRRAAPSGTAANRSASVGGPKKRPASRSVSGKNQKSLN